MFGKSLTFSVSGQYFDANHWNITPMVEYNFVQDFEQYNYPIFSPNNGRVITTDLLNKQQPFSDVSSVGHRRSSGFRQF